MKLKNYKENKIISLNLLMEMYNYFILDTLFKNRFGGDFNYIQSDIRIYLFFEIICKNKITFNYYVNQQFFRFLLIFSFKYSLQKCLAFYPFCIFYFKNVNPCFVYLL